MKGIVWRLSGQNVLIDVGVRIGQVQKGPQRQTESVFLPKPRIIISGVHLVGVMHNDLLTVRNGSQQGAADIHSLPHHLNPIIDIFGINRTTGDIGHDNRAQVNVFLIQVRLRACGQGKPLLSWNDSWCAAAIGQSIVECGIELDAAPRDGAGTQL